jgi:hypothetical protein
MCHGSPEQPLEALLPCAEVSHKAVSESWCVLEEVHARVGVRDDVVTDGPLPTDGMRVFGAHPQIRSSELVGGCATASARRGVPPRRRGRSSAGPSRPAARPKPPLSGTLPSPLLFPRQFPLLAQSYLEEHQEHNCAKAEGDQRDGEHFAGQPADQGGADRTRDDKRRGRSKCQDARAGRHRPKVSLRLAAESPGTRMPLRRIVGGPGARANQGGVSGAHRKAGGAAGASHGHPMLPPAVEPDARHFERRVTGECRAGPPTLRRACERGFHSRVRTTSER